MLPNAKIDDLAKNESKIDSTVADSKIRIPGYNLLRRYRNRFGGGVVVYIREVHSSDDFEMICIEICKSQNRPFLIRDL